MKNFSGLFTCFFFPVVLTAQTTRTLTIQSNPSNSSFAYFNSNPAFPGCTPTSTNIIVADWTTSGTPYNWRSVLKFDLSSIPADATIDSAYLYLFADPFSPSGNPGNPTFGTANATGIYRLADDWDTTTLGWDTPLGYSLSDADTLPQSTTTTENYLHRNVTRMVNNMVYTRENYGFLMKHLQETTFYNSMIFYSPYASTTDSASTPRLVITYTVATTEVSSLNSPGKMELSPNPAKDAVSIKVANQTDESFFTSITDCTGRVYFTDQLPNNSGSVSLNLNTERYPRGMYIVNLTGSNGSRFTAKLVLE